MFDIKKAQEAFTGLDHTQKLSKIRQILQVLSKKSSFFADLWNHFKSKNDIQENALDAIYNMVMNISYQQKEIK